MRIANRIMKRFNYDYAELEQFLLNLDFTPATLAQLNMAVETGGRVNHKEISKGPVELIRVMQYIGKLIDSMSNAKNDDDYSRMSSKLEALYHFLRARVPPYKNLPHEDFFRYVSCLSCKAPPPEEGHMVIDWEVSDTAVPISICKSCHDKNAEPDWELLARAYIVYSLNAKYDYDDMVASIGGGVYG